MEVEYPISRKRPLKIIYTMVVKMLTKACRLLLLLGLEVQISISLGEKVVIVRSQINALCYQFLVSKYCLHFTSCRSSPQPYGSYAVPPSADCPPPTHPAETTLYHHFHQKRTQYYIGLPARG